MENITVFVGSVTAGSGNLVQDNRREVEFEGEKLAKLTDYGTGRDGAPTDTRGVTETLYKTGDGRLVTHVEDWSRWQGEPDVCSLHEVTAADLSGSGRFARLGIEAGYGHPLTLDEALAGDEMRGDDELSDLERLAGGEAVPCVLCRRMVQPGEGFYGTTEGAVICMDCSDSD